MKNLSRFGFVLILGTAACSGGPPVTDAGDSGTTGDSTMNMNDSTNPGDGSNPADTGGGGMDCAAVATRFCGQMNTCTPHLLLRTYEDMARCVAVQTESCTGGFTFPMNGTIADPTACAAALADCNTYLAVPTITPAVCKPRPGGVAAGGMCGIDTQCGTGLYCYGITKPTCQDGVCGTPDGPNSGNICNMAIAQGRPDPCDRNNDKLCSQLYDSTQATFIGDTGTYRCRQVTYGGANAACLDGTDKRCAPGFKCLNRACLAVRQENEPCDGTLSGLCDTRKGLTCQTVALTTNKTCRPAPFARLGAQCGVVIENGVTEMRACATAVARCNSAVPSVCEALKTKDEACTSSPNNCRSGFVCMGGTCQTPPATTCP